MQHRVSVKSEGSLDDVAQLNIAATCGATAALGPGLRSVAWVQGCPFRCRGCVAPEWIPDVPATRMSSCELAERLVEHPDVVGVTLSGGEPMHQAGALAGAVDLARRERDLSVICFTGYQLERLRSTPPSTGVHQLLAVIDVLIDGPYVKRLDDGVGLRGSSNQRIHHLTNRLRDSDFDFDGRARDVELTVTQDSIQLVGVPTQAALAAFDSIAPPSEGEPA